VSQAPPETLLSLSQVDKKILHLLSRKNEIQTRLETHSRQIAAEKKRVATLESALQQQQTRQSEEETRIKDEEKKIAERRKQLTALGGAKAAKMVEREIDISSRLMQQLEERMLKTLEGIETSKTTLAAAAALLDGLQTTFEAERPAGESALSEIEAQLGSSTEERDKLLSVLETNLLRLYERVRSRYPGDPIALAINGSCIGCFRALPMNLFHQVLAGGIGIQCPGCSRILVVGEAAPEEKASGE
jgi:predicted  nucleic acid-binding Zn-ribbon protein